MNAKEFIAKIEQDAKENNFAVLEKIQAAGKNPEAVYAIAQEVGVTDSFEVFQAEMTQAYKAMTAELSEEELLAVAGGAMTEDEKTASIVGSTIGGVIGIAFLAYAI